MITLSPPAYSAATFAHVGLQVGVLVGDGGERAVQLLRRGRRRRRSPPRAGPPQSTGSPTPRPSMARQVPACCTSDWSLSATLPAHREQRARLRAALQAAPQLAVALAPLRRRRLQRADPVPAVGVELARSGSRVTIGSQRSLTSCRHCWSSGSVGWSAIRTEPACSNRWVWRAVDHRGVGGVRPRPVQAGARLRRRCGHLDDRRGPGGAGSAANVPSTGTVAPANVSRVATASIVSAPTSTPYTIRRYGIVAAIRGPRRGGAGRGARRVRIHDDRHHAVISHRAYAREGGVSRAIGRRRAASAPADVR